ncbi:MAG: hypothetical protein EBU90_12775 [Proteobacteria bacterium]|nr:hypothetical protein [Pseudomonadota bacterium]NBP14871.1 hypothetical protein [bacterium]
MFSIPINPKLSQEEFQKFYKFVAENKDVIYDLYFTSRMPPFIQDAMGDVFDISNTGPIETALFIQESLGVKVSATFNNTLVRPNQENLDLFIHNFKQLYNAGIRSATIPHTHWLMTGQIQKEFPDLFIKNTILWDVNRANDVAKLAEAGFHYVNLDRDLMRDRDELAKCKKVAKKYNIKLSLLANEGCLGGCSVMKEHFQFNNTRGPDGAQYFNDLISRVSCPKWEYEDPSTMLKTANFPPWREDWIELLDYVDVIKMHGRESISRLFETIDIVERFRNKKEILFDSFNEYLEETNLEGKPITAWRNKIKNCKFDCWDCDYCDKVYAAKSDIQAHPKTLLVTKELVDSVNEDVNFNIEGLTSNRVQKFLNRLAKNSNVYLEIGSALGATALPVAQTNIEVHCVDNWSSNVQPMNDEFELPDNTKKIFLDNLKGYQVNVHDSDLFNVDLSKINNVDLFFYDGPHDVQTTAKAVKYYKDCFADTVIMIFDDANWQGVVQGADLGISLAKLNVIYSKKMLNSPENKNMWWNGLYIVVAQK